MKSKNIIIFIGLIVSISLLISGYSGNKSAKVSDRDRLFNTGWKFVRDSISKAEQPVFDDSKWMMVDLPHDYSIMDLPGEDGPDQVGPFSRKSPGNGNSTGHVIGGTGWYRKSFALYKADEGKTAILNFDGVYMETEVWVNGKKAGIHKNGYTPFWFDITSLLNAAGKTNVIAVKVDNVGRNSRWYSGSGIYRNVHLTMTQPVHVAEWGVYITTPVVNQNSALIDIAVTTRNDGEKGISANITINIKDKDGRLTGTAKDNIVLSGKAENITKKQIEVKNPVLWSVESPNLYNAEILIEVDKKVTDKYNQTFGNRTTDARHFTSFSLRQATGNKSAEVDAEVKILLNLMNAMYFIGQNNSGCAQYWWIRHGTSDNHTSQTVITNLATSLENRNKVVNTSLYWDAGHGADQDPEDFIVWIGNVTGFSK